MLVPARGSAPLRGCFRKGLTDSPLRAFSGYAGKGKSSPFRPPLRKKGMLTVRWHAGLRRRRSILQSQNIRELSA
jgi:hypothetical protein